MNLQSNLQYPFLKYILEEFSGSFFQNDITCLNRMLILYHNRLLFSIHDDTDRYLDDYKAYLHNPVNFWYIPSIRRERINRVRLRMAYILENNRIIFEQLLSRNDYNSQEAKQQTLVQIYRWLEVLPEANHLTSGVDVNEWKRELKKNVVDSLVSPVEITVQKVLKKSGYGHFSELLTGETFEDKYEKFQRLITILIDNQWIEKANRDDLYMFRYSGRGARLQLAALYYVLNAGGHITEELMATQIAELFNGWLTHKISKDSFIKAFQAEQQDTFNCGTRQSRYKYVQDCRLLLRDL
jgi:hypothetical protein